MVLEGWSQPPSAEKRENHTVSDAGTSNSSRPVFESCEDAEITVEEESEAVPPKKRKLPAIFDQAAASLGGSSVPADAENRRKVEDVDDDDDDDVMVMLDRDSEVADGDLDVAKKRKLV